MIEKRIVDELRRQYPNASSKTLGRIAQMSRYNLVKARTLLNSYFRYTNDAVYRWDMFVKMSQRIKALEKRVGQLEKERDR